MPLSDLPMATLVVFFLVIFVLIGLYPAWQRTADRIRKFLQSSGRPQEPFAEQVRSAKTAIFAEPQQTTRQLNDFEIIVLRRLAQNGGKTFSRKQVNADLHLEPEIIHKTLKSLYRRGLIQIAVTPLFGQRFYLSPKGLDYAVEQGFILKIQERSGRF